jgi:hypothetical protein
MAGKGNLGGGSDVKSKLEQSVCTMNRLNNEP